MVKGGVILSAPFEKIAKVRMRPMSHDELHKLGGRPLAGDPSPSAGSGAAAFRKVV
jgi:hypothetical protein